MYGVATGQLNILLRQTQHVAPASMAFEQGVCIFFKTQKIVAGCVSHHASH